MSNVGAGSTGSTQSKYILALIGNHKTPQHQATLYANFGISFENNVQFKDLTFSLINELYN